MFDAAVVSRVSIVRAECSRVVLEVAFFCPHHILTWVETIGTDIHAGGQRTGVKLSGRFLGRK